MIRNLIYRIFLLVILIVFLASSTGIILYIHHCSCRHQIYASLIEEHNCRSSRVTDCCTNSHAGFNFSSDNSCSCNSEQLMIHIDDPYISLTFSTEVKQFFCQIDHHNQPLLKLFDYHSNTLNNLSYYFPEESPPVKTVGRVLIFFLHQVKAVDHLL